MIIKIKKIILYLFLFITFIVFSSTSYSKTKIVKCEKVNIEFYLDYSKNYFVFDLDHEQGNDLSNLDLLFTSISKGQIIVYGKTYPLIEFGYDNSVVDALYIRDKRKGWVGFIKYSPVLNKINLITPLGIGDYNGECN